eukprot:4820629-Pleurochrysis_carterae.AAC.1
MVTKAACTWLKGLLLESKHVCHKRSSRAVALRSRGRGVKVRLYNLLQLRAIRNLGAASGWRATGATACRAVASPRRSVRSV